MSHLIPNSSLVLLSDGRVCKVHSSDLGLAGDLGLSAWIGNGGL